VHDWFRQSSGGFHKIAVNRVRVVFVKVQLVFLVSPKFGGFRKIAVSRVRVNLVKV